jgi:hypothetical protein
VPYDHSKSIDVNHASAAGVLADKLLDARQQSMIHHPSGRRRFHFDQTGNGVRTITLDV